MALESTHQAALDLFQQACFGVDLQAKARLALDTDYWLHLCPEMNMNNDDLGVWEPCDSFVYDTIDHACQQYRETGHFELSNALSVPQSQRMRAVIEKLRNEKWPAVFAFVYDAFWSIGATPRIRALLERLLGTQYRLRSGIWSHYVEPRKGSAGWSPHTDGNTHSPFAISIWVPISEATLDNGCMHVVTRDDTTEEMSRNYSKTKAFVKADVNAFFRNVRALPASPGTVLGWDQSVIHWGGSFLRGVEPRISLALEFSAVDAEGQTTASFLDPLSLPNFHERLAMISRAILKYRRFEKPIDNFATLAETLLTAMDPSAGANTKS